MGREGGVAYPLCFICHPSVLSFSFFLSFSLSLSPSLSLSLCHVPVWCFSLRHQRKLSQCHRGQQGDEGEERKVTIESVNWWRGEGAGGRVNRGLVRSCHLTDTLLISPGDRKQTAQQRRQCQGNSFPLSLSISLSLSLSLLLSLALSL